MKFVQRQVSTAASKHSGTNFEVAKQQVLRDVTDTVRMEKIPAELALYLDQTGIRIFPSNTWTMEWQGIKHVELSGTKDKRMFTAVFSRSLVSDICPVQLIYQGTTARCHPHYESPPHWDVTHSKKHWSNEETMNHYIDNIIVLYINANRENFEDETPAVIITDDFKGQITPQISNLLE